MASRGGLFKATASDLPRAREYLAQRGIEYRGHSPKQAQRVANAVAKQEAAGLIANRAAARGHGATPEHPGRKPRKPFSPPKAEREKQPAAAGKELKVGTRREYQRVHHAIPKNQRYQQFPDGQEIYKTTSGHRAGEIIRFEASAYEGKRIDIEVTYENGVTHRFFVGDDHKRNGEHAIDAKVLAEKLDAAGGNMERLIFDTTDSNRSDTYPPVGVPILSYTINVY